ncbi:GNAT family N-acetyltransferase [Shewanella sp. 202IG2-18]|uniref:GNAT family N-acetyltransferase n=1 Tax=Parashewanella hymeniacidonis TaxID=2807618 RepID=UPI0019617B36|nr:GNAT family N-acetyltransferase [Parashewanella hymeniacidonis]MBM7073759.1 GNAT family N-acetyltransferase [Parashewanella hymeniacidonis]
MIFREAKLFDLPILQALEQAVVEAERPFNSTIKPESATYYDIEHLITDNDSYLIVLEDNKQIIATGYGQIRSSKQSLNHDKHCYLGFMYVLPEFRGRGLNKQLLNKIIEWSRQRGVNDFYLDVYSQNISAIKAYEKLGFEPCLLEMKLNLS